MTAAAPRVLQAVGPPDARVLALDFASGAPDPTELAAWDIVIARSGMNSEPFHAVANRARKACHRLFVAGDWNPGIDKVNFAQRCAPPELIDKQDQGNSENRAAIQAIRTTPLFAWLTASLGREPDLKGGRLRFQPADEINHHLHQDAYFLDGRFLTIWIPAVAPGIRCNRDAPGLEFLGRKIGERLDSDPEDASRIDPQALADAMSPDDPDPVFARPALTLGDALLFREFVPHGGYIPPQATEAKTSFDFRFFVD